MPVKNSNPLDDSLPQFRIEPEFLLPEYVQMGLEEIFQYWVQAYLLTSASRSNTTENNAALCWGSVPKDYRRDSISLLYPAMQTIFANCINNRMIYLIWDGYLSHDR